MTELEKGDDENRYVREGSRVVNQYVGASVRREIVKGMCMRSAQTQNRAAKTAPTTAAAAAAGTLLEPLPLGVWLVPGAEAEAEDPEPERSVAVEDDGLVDVDTGGVGTVGVLTVEVTVEIELVDLGGAEAVLPGLD